MSVGEAAVVLISPERMSNAEFVRDRLLPVADRIALLVVDEAHCISCWGHDFRPDYRRRLLDIVQVIDEGTPILCTTATATNRVAADIRLALLHCYFLFCFGHAQCGGHQISKMRNCKRMWDTLHLGTSCNTAFDRSSRTLCTVGGGGCGRRVAWQRSVGGTTVTTDAATSSVNFS